jgi:hypothetical protein
LQNQSLKEEANSSKVQFFLNQPYPASGTVNISPQSPITFPQGFNFTILPTDTLSTTVGVRDDSFSYHQIIIPASHFPGSPRPQFGQPQPLKLRATMPIDVNFIRPGTYTLNVSSVDVQGPLMELGGMITDSNNRETTVSHGFQNRILYKIHFRIGVD